MLIEFLNTIYINSLSLSHSRVNKDINNIDNQLDVTITVY